MRASRVTLGEDVADVSLELKDASGTAAETVGTVSLFGFQPDPENADMVFAHAALEDPEFGPLGSFPVRLRRKIQEAKEYIIEHRGPAAAAGTALAAGTVAVGSLWVRRHHRK